jgi:hypothetical protein
METRGKDVDPADVELLMAVFFSEGELTMPAGPLQAQGRRGSRFVVMW